MDEKPYQLLGEVREPIPAEAVNFPRLAAGGYAEQIPVPVLKGSEFGVRPKKTPEREQLCYSVQVILDIMSFVKKKS
jgi:hypothetical protein